MSVKKDLNEIIEDLTPRGVHGKLIRAVAAIDVVEKNGRNDHFKFNFQKWDQVITTARSAMQKAGLSLTVDMVDVQYIDKRVLVKLQVELYDPEANETRQSFWFGEAMTTDDKAIQKAATSAFKYWLLKNLQIRSEEDETDAEGPAKPAPEPKVTKEKWEEVIGKLEPTKQWLDAFKKQHGKDAARLLVEAVDAGCKTTDAVDDYLENGVAP